MKRLASVALSAVLLVGCASMRGVDVTSDPNRTYAISVYNTRGSVILVAYNDGAVTRQLGEVGSGDRERFVVIASPNNARITVLPRTTSGTALPSQSVNLIAGQTTSVTIR